MKKSSDGGCSWGQVHYGWYFDPDLGGEFVEQDEKMYLELIEKAAAQNNPRAIYRRGRDHYEKWGHMEALVDYCMAAELGWRFGKEELYRMFIRSSIVVESSDFICVFSWFDANLSSMNYKTDAADVIKHNELIAIIKWS